MRGACLRSSTEKRSRFDVTRAQYDIMDNPRRIWRGDRTTAARRRLHPPTSQGVHDVEASQPPPQGTEAPSP
jgi:hypothetical protein